MRVEIEIYSDIVCPWCYLATARLEAALGTFDAEVIVHWRAFQLDPDAPHGSRPLMPWLAQRFGGMDQARQTAARVAALAAAEGLSLDFDRAVIANTFDAHRLLWFADQPQTVFCGAGPDTQAELAGSLHRAHFSEGRDVGSYDVLVDVAEGVGLEGDRVRTFLDSTEGTADVRAQIAHAHDVGITSVPTFVFAGKYAVTGAQETGTLRSVLGEVARREGSAPTLRSLIPEQRAVSTSDHDSDPPLSRRS
jgi:predicted DsbA family dithiol-disulfide isomerase